MAERMYGSIVKADVDISKNTLVVDMDMHSDGEAFLLEQGSKQEDLWGLNLHPDRFGTDDFVEFDSMINIRPRQNNPSRNIFDEAIRTKIYDIIKDRVHE